MIPVNLLLEKGATYKQLEPNEIVFQEGSAAAFYYQLVSGRIRWCNIMEDGREVLHKIAEPGDVIGVLPLFDDGMYASNGIADCSSTVLRLCKDTFLEILREDPTIHFMFSRSLVKDIRFKFLLTNAWGQHSPEVILTNLFRYFNDQRKGLCQECNQVMLTRQQLANMTGLRVETIIRTIKNMEKDERLSIVKGKVFIPVE